MNEIQPLSLLKKVPGGRELVDRYATQQVENQLNRSGQAEYRTNEADYKMGSA